jgi:Aminomethyltransferase folate-binding domain
MTTPSLITHPLAHPFYADLRMFSRAFGRLQAWEFDGWKPESMSWKTGCYIHAGLSGPSQTTFTGREAAEFLSSICINGFSNFPNGGSKHAIMLTEDGLIASHALLQRNTEDRFRMFATPPWAIYQASKSRFAVQFEVDEIYLLQIAGPTCLQTLERATGEDLRDVEFLRFRPTSVDGKPTEICRIGMSGTLAYELRGPIAQGPEIYDAVVRAGADLGIQRLGWRTYMVNHVEGGYPQLTWTFMFAAYEDPGYREFAPADDAPIVSGSVDPADPRPTMPLSSRAASIRPTCGRATARRSSSAGTARRVSTTSSSDARHLKQRSPTPSGRSSRCAGIRRTSSTSTPPSSGRARSTRLHHRHRPGGRRHRGHRQVGRFRGQDQGRPGDGRTLPIPRPGTQPVLRPQPRGFRPGSSVSPDGGRTR